MGADDPIRLHAAGRVSAEVALARLILNGHDPETLAAHILSAGNAALARIAGARGDGLRRLKALLDGSGLHHGVADADPAAAIAAVRTAFDRAVAASPEASVAAYSLGDGDLLRQATGEIVCWLDGLGVLRPDTDMLDFGCGIGRIAAAVAPHVRSVLGLDLSPAMIGTARRRAALPNLRFATTAGADLADQPDARFALILAVDSFPYLFGAGRDCAQRHMADFARIVRPGGAITILNLSYRGPAEDLADARAWAAAHRLTLAVAGATPFALWDGRAFLWRKPDPRDGG
ncbi:MAG: class I SAM-dependent methyltransferase [Acetobacteraceae bacterium]|nr:class I SAM-dependent methyltransferase [Acetobacteraceae bacterium]